MRWPLAIAAVASVSILVPAGYFWLSDNPTSEPDRSAAPPAVTAGRDALKPDARGRPGIEPIITKAEGEEPQQKSTEVTLGAKAPMSPKVRPDSLATPDAANSKTRPTPETASTEPETAAAEPVKTPESARTPEPETAAAEPEDASVKPKTWAIVTVSLLNMRKEPDRTVRIIASYTRDTKLEIVERGEVWIKLRYPETGKVGWMNSKYLKFLPPEYVPEKEDIPSG